MTVTQNQANDNAGFFMLMPVNTNVVASTVTITNITPDGSALYNQNTTFSFNAFSPTAPVDPNNILVTVTATNLWLHGSVTSPTLTVTGPEHEFERQLPHHLEHDLFGVHSDYGRGWAIR